MLSRRTFVASLAATLASPSIVRSMPVSNATFVFTFDTYRDAIDTAWPLMLERGLVGTVYVDPSLVGQSGQLTVADMILMKQTGLEIGLYLQGSPNMADMQVNNRNTAYQKLVDSDNAMNALGFKIATAAPNSREWNAALANMSRGRWKGIRANKSTAEIPSTIQPYPLPDPMWIKGGGKNSWSGSDTAAILCAQIDEVIANNSLGISVTHKLGTTGSSDTVLTSVATAAYDYAATKVAAGLLRVCTVEQALTP